MKTAWNTSFPSPKKTQRNYFFYVDPYGVKCLDFRYFARLKGIGFISLEVLVNLNTTGFLREGCRLLKYTCELPDWTDDLDYEQDERNSLGHMDNVAGGDYWRNILNDFQAGVINFHQAEDRFAAEYTRRIRNILPLVVHVAIRERSRQLPKYRLLFATNHRDGLFLMTDTMHKAWIAQLDHETGGQLTFSNDVQWPVQPGQSIEERIWAVLGEPMELGKLLTVLIEHHGITHSTSEYKKAIRTHEGKLFTVNRIPDKTPTGKLAHHLDYDAAQIMISKLAYQQDWLR